MITLENLDTKKYKKVVIIGEKRSNDDFHESFKKNNKECEVVYYDDFLFIPKPGQSQYNLHEVLQQRVEDLGKENFDLLIVSSSKMSRKLANRISEISDIELYYHNQIVEKGSINIIDSGIGGLLVAKKINELLPSELINVIIDSEFMPYGNKDSRIIQRRATQLIKFVKTLNPKQVVLACNTLDSIAGERIAAQLGGISLIDIINNCCKEAADVTKGSEIALIATPNTIDSHKYMYELLKYTSSKHLIGLSCDNLAKAIENNDKIKETFNEEIKPLEDFEFETLILGCTHYSKIKPLVLKKFENINIIDSVEVVSNCAVNSLKESNIDARATKGGVKVYLTKDSEVIRNNIYKNFDQTDLEINVMEV